MKLSPNVAQTTIKTSKSSIITSVHKNSFDGAEISEEDELKSSERLFENWICKKSPRMVSAADTSKVVVKKKNRLSLVKSQNTANSKMRQSTITFQSATVSFFFSLRLESNIRFVIQPKFHSASEKTTER